MRARYIFILAACGLLTALAVLGLFECVSNDPGDLIAFGDGGAIGAKIVIDGNEVGILRDDGVAFHDMPFAFNPNGNPEVSEWLYREGERSAYMRPIAVRRGMRKVRVALVSGDTLKADTTLLYYNTIRVSGARRRISVEGRDH